MTAYAIAARNPDTTLRLFLRVVRAPSGIYVVFASGQRRPGIGRKQYNPHASWHRDGRVHQKSHDRRWIRQTRQALAGFTGAEPFISTSVDQLLAPELPECNPSEFSTVMEVPVLDTRPGRQQICVDLVASGAEPPAFSFGERVLMRWWITDDSPGIVVSLYQLSFDRN